MRTTLAILTLAIFAYLLTGTAQIRPDERAVVRRFGAVVARPGPGLWIGLPWGVDRIDRVRTRTARQIEVGFQPDADTDSTGQYLTGDQNLANVRLVIEYAVGESDADLDDFVVNGDSAEAILAREADALTAEWIAARPIDDVLLTGRAALPARLLAKLPNRLAAHHLGIGLTRASVAHLAAPAEVRDAFEAVNQAQTAIRTRETQAMQARDQRLREAAVVQFRSEQEAEAYRREAALQATADAESFAKRLEQYRTLSASNAHVKSAIWWDEIGRTLVGMKQRGRIDLLDDRLAPGGLDVTQFFTPRGSGSTIQGD